MSHPLPRPAAAPAADATTRPTQSLATVRAVHAPLPPDLFHALVDGLATALVAEYRARHMPPPTASP